MWDDLLRVAASVKGGHATAALVVGKLCSSRRLQNALASAIKEYDALRRTVYAATSWTKRTGGGSAGRRRGPRRDPRQPGPRSMEPRSHYGGIVVVAKSCQLVG
jgi:hypothetical protein